MKKLTKEEFINRAKCLLGDNYDFTKTTYIDSHTRTIITCKIHGDFLAYPTNVLERSCGCPECAREKISRSKFMPLREFIRKALKKHFGKYDYSLVDYIDSTTKIKIICPIHGVFEQSPANHLRGCGCPKCARTRRG
jgi:hypothetical protein